MKPREAFRKKSVSWEGYEQALKEVARNFYGSL